MAIRIVSKAIVFCAVIIAAATLAQFANAQVQDLPPALPNVVMAEATTATPSVVKTITAPTKPTQWMLLRTGGLLEGDITLEKNSYRVRTQGSNVRIRKQDVELVCKSIAEVVAYKRASLFEDSVIEHLRLAQWCLRHQQFGFAKEELWEARRINPNSPRLQFVEQHIAIAEKLAAKKKTIQQNGKSIATAAHPKRHRVSQASFEEPVEEQTGNDAPDGQPDSMTHVSPIATRYFTRTIQPILLNNCTQGGCHQISGSHSFQLDRLALQRGGGRTTTLRNLAATLDWVDTEKPEASRLLIEANRAHGLQSKSPFIGRKMHLYQSLQAWVYRLRNQTPVAKATKANDEHEPAATR